MLCYASLAYMPWPEGLRTDIAMKQKFEWFASIWSLIAILRPSLYIFQSWVLDWTESPIVNQLVAIDYLKKLRPLVFWGVGDRTAGERKGGRPQQPPACLAEAVLSEWLSLFSISISQKISQIPQIPSWLDWTTSTSRHFLLLQELALILHIL